MSVKLPAALIFVCALAVPASGSADPTGICPLSDEQTQKSIEAFSKIAPTLKGEPRCTGCHGRVNPYMDGVGEEEGRPDVPPSLSEHGGGRMDRGHIVNGLREGESDCTGCHSNMPLSRILGKSRWMTAPDELAFIGKDTRTLCEQIRNNIARAENFVGHITDDNGFNNFAGAAFEGRRGLDDSYSESEVPTEKPAISHGDLITLGKAWVATTGGEFQGDKSCGCAPAHYALRVSVLNEINLGLVHHSSVLAPVDIPITFEDDGTFSGDGDLNYHGTGSALACTEQTGSQLNVHVSGKATETADEHTMNVKFEKSSPSVTTMSAQCPYHRPTDTQTVNAQAVSLHLEFTGDVGEIRDYQMPGSPGVSSTMHVEIVKLP